MPCRLEGCVFNRGWTICRVCLLTVHDHVHILDKTVDDLQSLTCSSPSLIVGKSIQSLEDSLDFLLSKGLLHKFDCVVLSKVIQSARTDSLDRPRLSSFVANANVENNSTIILTTISSIAGVGGIRVYISRRLRKCSTDSSNSTNAL